LTDPDTRKAAERVVKLAAIVHSRPYAHDPIGHRNPQVLACSRRGASSQCNTRSAMTDGADQAVAGTNWGRSARLDASDGRPGSHCPPIARSGENKGQSLPIGTKTTAPFCAPRRFRPESPVPRTQNTIFLLFPDRAKKKPI
jgi:hypothetical protein